MIIMKERSYDIKVFVNYREEKCFECGKIQEIDDLITLDKRRNVICLTCADLDHLEFLPSGDHALTTRARKYSALSAVVLKYSRTRKRNERQGLLVETKALELAEKDCLADIEIRERRRKREAIRRARLDREYIKKFASKTRDYYPSIPKGLENEIAEHACLKYSGRVGRSAEAKDFSKSAIILAARAHIRHNKTEYDSLLAAGSDRFDARSEVENDIDSILSEWEKSK